jgi:hypothetical protein
MKRVRKKVMVSHLRDTQEPPHENDLVGDADQLSMGTPIESA